MKESELCNTSPAVDLLTRIALIPTYKSIPIQLESIWREADTPWKLSVIMKSNFSILTDYVFAHVHHLTTKYCHHVRCAEVINANTSLSKTENKIPDIKN